MLVQDMLTGQLHEVPEYGMATPQMDGWPDPQAYGLGEVHDGFGNSLGLFFLPKLIKGAVSAVSNLVQRAGEGGSALLPPPPAAAAPSCPPCPPCRTCGTPVPAAAMAPSGHPFPYPPFRRRRRR